MKVKWHFHFANIRFALSPNLSVKRFTNHPDVSLVEDLAFSDSRTIPSRSVSQLSHTSLGSGSAGGPRGSSSYLPGPDDSGEEEDDDHCQPYLLYHSHLGPCSHTSQESLNSANPPPQVSSMLHVIVAMLWVEERLCWTLCVHTTHYKLGMFTCSTSFT